MVFPLCVCACEYVDFLAFQNSYHMYHTQMVSHQYGYVCDTAKMHCLWALSHKCHRGMFDYHLCERSHATIVTSCMRTLCHRFHIHSTSLDYHSQLYVSRHVAFFDVSLSNACRRKPFHTHHTGKDALLCVYSCDPVTQYLCNIPYHRYDNEIWSLQHASFDEFPGKLYT